MQNSFLFAYRNILSLQKHPELPKKIVPKFPYMLKKTCTWIHSSKSTNGLKITLPVRFSRVLPTTKQYIQQYYYQRFNLVACLSPKQFRTFNHKCLNTLVLSISDMKLFKLKLKTWDKLAYWIRKSSFINSFRQQEKLWHHLRNPCLKMCGKGCLVPLLVQTTP